MPLVGNKHFAYTSKGMKQALAHAEKTGQKVKVDKKGLGGMVKKYNQGGPLKGPSHKKGGIPAVVKGGQPIEMEGGEYVIKKDSAKQLGPDILNYINKTGSVPKMAEGGTVNPYLKQYKAAQEGEMAALAALPQQGSDEYEKLRRERYQKTGKWGNTGQRRWQMYQGDLMKASAGRKQAAKRGKARGEQAMGLSSLNSNISMLGGLKARAHQKAAARQMKGGGRIDGSSLFSLLKKLGR